MPPGAGTTADGLRPARPLRPGQAGPYMRLVAALTGAAGGLRGLGAI
jgi:hypothetical protein